jgi:DNA-binding beta-propeller fold protein YncE
MRVRSFFPSSNRLRLIIPIALIVLLILVALFRLALRDSESPNISTGTATVGKVGGVTTTKGRNAIQHYEYTFLGSGINVYDMDNGFKLAKTISLPTEAGVRGVVASPVTHMLYVSYGGDGGPNGNGSLLKYDLVADKLVWTKTYSHGIDSMAISPTGKTIYMPDGELSSDGKWYVIDANNGNEIATINGGRGPHNTIVSLNGKHVYLGGRNHNYLEVADTSTNRVIKYIGPLMSGVRPFTLNGAETLAYISVTGFLGFQVADITTGHVLYTVPIKGFSWNGNSPSDPSHGISLSPDERELYVMDSPNSYVHVFDISKNPFSAPKQIADIKVTSMAGNENNCAYDCLRDGWLQHSRDGRFVFVGDSGDVIDTITHKSITNLPTLANTRKMLEIDWQNGRPIFTTSRSGLGYVTTP